MPRWEGLHGQRFAFSIEGYQYPEILDGHDANWVFLEVEAENEQGSWERRCACMLTWEIAWFAKWLKNVVLGRTDESLRVLEGDLKLLVAKAQGSHRLMVCLEYGLAYENMAVLSGERDKSVIGVCLTDEEVDKAVAYFEDRFAAFPPRGEQGRRLYEKLPGLQILDG
jgi:hypothetical protein